MKTERLSNTANRLREIMNERGLRQVDIVNMCQPYCRLHHIIINKADISIWLKGTVEPRSPKLYVLCLALNVSEPWMMGFDVPRERQPRQGETQVDMIYTKDGAEHRIDLKGLDDAQKRLVAEYVALLKRSKK